jgi:DNA-binding NtrC family response regulator
MKPVAAGKKTMGPISAEPAVAVARVLIVDDEEVIASTLKEFLEGEGFEAATAHDLSSALAIVETFEPDVVLCDVQLPGSDGLTVLHRVLEVRPETLFIMITAYATVENAVAAFQSGAHDYLMKPVLFDELLAKIGRLTQFRSLLRENQALRRQLPAPGDLSTIVGDSFPIEAVKSLIRKVAPMRCSWRSIARPFLMTCSKISSSATFAVPSPALIATSRACLSPPAAVRSFLTRSAS